MYVRIIREIKGEEQSISLAMTFVHCFITGRGHLLGALIKYPFKTIILRWYDCEMILLSFL